MALGKLGSHEMTIGSDLDLIFIYDAPAELEGAGWDTLMSDGPKPLAPIHYYARLAQRMIAAITAPTGEGRRGRPPCCWTRPTAAASRKTRRTPPAPPSRSMHG